MPCVLNLLVAAQPRAIKGEEVFAVGAVHEGTAAFCGKASLSTDRILFSHWRDASVHGVVSSCWTRRGSFII
jgi:hypothetical protein